MTALARLSLGLMPDQSHLPVKYDDKYIKLIGIFLVTALNYYLTYHNVALDLVNVLFFTSDVLTAWLSWEVLKWQLHVLDKHIPWARDARKRFLVQITLGTLVILMANVALNEAVDIAFFDRARMKGFYAFDLLLIALYIIIVQFVYIALYFIRNAQQEGRVTDETSKQLIMGVGNSKLVKKIEDIWGFESKEKVTYAWTSTGQRHIVDYSLNHIEGKVGQGRFFRLNRQYIVSIDAIKSTKSLEYGKKSVELCYGDQHVSTIVSRKKAPGFRKWLTTKA